MGSHAQEFSVSWFAFTVERRVLRFTAGLPARYPFCRVCGVVSFVSGIRVIGLGPLPFYFSLSVFK